MTDTPCPTCGHKPEPISLSRRQKQIYAFVVEYIATSGQSPMWKEIAYGLEFKTKDQAWNCAQPLFARGILGKNENASRSIIVLVQPGEIFPTNKGE